MRKKFQQKVKEQRLSPIHLLAGLIPLVCLPFYNSLCLFIGQPDSIFLRYSSSTQVNLCKNLSQALKKKKKTKCYCGGSSDIYIVVTNKSGQS